MGGLCICSASSLSCLQRRQRRLFLEGIAHGERDVSVVIARIFAIPQVCKPVLVAQFEAIMVGNLHAGTDGEARVKPLVAVLLEYFRGGMAGYLVLPE